MHAVAAALCNAARQKHRLVCVQNAREEMERIIAESPDAPAVEILDRADIDLICGADAVHQGVGLLVSPLPDVAVEDLIQNPDSAPKTVLMLDQATDPRNVGAILRSARAFGVHAVIVQDRHAPPETGAMAKAASGALETVQLVRVTNLARALWTLKDAGYWSTGLDGHAENELSAINFDGKNVIVLGAEGAGLRRLTRETCDQLARIPISEEAESLNISNAAAIALYVVTQGPTGI